MGGGGRLIFAYVNGRGPVTSEPLPLGGGPLRPVPDGYARAAGTATVLGGDGEITAVSWSVTGEVWPAPLDLDLPAGRYRLRVDVARPPDFGGPLFGAGVGSGCDLPPPG